jgi:multidrug efflux pump subunit AcrA (membrane-fusion protein)
MTTTTNVGTLVRAQQEKDHAARRSNVTTWKTYTLTVREPRPDSIAIGTGEMERVQDKRDGSSFERERRIFLSRRHVRVISGLLVPGQTIVVDVPSWLAERTGLDRVKGLVP